MIRAAILLFAGMSACAQTKAGLAPPREIDRAARRVEQSWNAWREAGPERRLLNEAPATALAAIDRSAALAARYVTEKKAYYSLIAGALRRSAVALMSETDETAAGDTHAEQQLKRLEARQEAIRDTLAAAGRPEDERTAAMQQAYRAQGKAMESLSEEARRQIAVLRDAARTSEDLAKQRKAAAEALGRAAEAVEQVNATVDMEGETLALYHEHLRALVREQAQRHAPGAAGRTTLSDELDALLPRPAPPKKDQKEDRP
ncbi:MAG: hypothetical protein LAP87_18450 [Acidobacteriia bacterium]|nr:hypothetical protein [Terriglobia bacterium]